MLISVSEFLSTKTLSIDFRAASFENKKKATCKQNLLRAASDEHGECLAEEGGLEGEICGL